MWWEIILWIVGGYLLLGFLTALALSQTPYSDNGMFWNTVLAVFYWVAAARRSL